MQAALLLESSSLQLSARTRETMNGSSDQRSYWSKDSDDRTFPRTYYRSSSASTWGFESLRTPGKALSSRTFAVNLWREYQVWSSTQGWFSMRVLQKQVKGSTTRKASTAKGYAATGQSRSWGTRTPKTMIFYICLWLVVEFLLWGFVYPTI